VSAAPLAADRERRLADVGQGERAVTGHRPEPTAPARGPRGGKLAAALRALVAFWALRAIRLWWARRLRPDDFTSSLRLQARRHEAWVTS
jgi:hypothetical protein